MLLVEIQHVFRKQFADRTHVATAYLMIFRERGVALEVEVISPGEQIQEVLAQPTARADREIREVGPAPMQPHHGLAERPEFRQDNLVIKDGEADTVARSILEVFENG